MEDILVRPYHIEHEGMGERKNEGVSIRMHALDKDNNPYLIRVENVPLSLYVELPRKSMYGGNVTWNQASAEKIYNEIVERLGRKANLVAFHPKNFVYYESLYGYSVPESTNIKISTNQRIEEGYQRNKPFLSLWFNTLESFRYAIDPKNGLFANAYNGPNFAKVKLKIHEENIDVISKFLAYTDNRHCYWMNIKCMRVSEMARISNIKNEFIASFLNVKHAPDELTKNLQTHPKILGFDIEVYSDNPKIFPRATLDAHVCYMISVMTKRDGSKENPISYALVFGDYTEIPPEKYEGKIVEWYPTEEDMIFGFCDKIIEYDPEVIITFNGLTFDWDYLNNRLGKMGLKWPVMGRYKNVRTTVTKGKGWSSSAYGFNRPDNVLIPGRLNFDLFIIIKRETKLSEYSLSAVSLAMIKKDKLDVKPEVQFKLYEIASKGLEFPPGSSERLQGQEAILKLIDYCVRDTELCFDLFEHMKLWISSVEMSNVMRVNMIDLYLRGQQMRCESQLYESCYKNNIVMDYREATQIPFVGGSVYCCTEDYDVDDIDQDFQVLFDRVMYIDFQSLYPSIIIANNICYKTYVYPEFRCHDPTHTKGNVPHDCKKVHKHQCNTIEVDCRESFDPKLDVEGMDEEELEEIKTGKNFCNGIKKLYDFWFVKKEIYEGVLPKLVNTLCETRRDVQALEKKAANGSFEKLLYFKRQTALKVSANSFYGFLGVLKNGKRPLREAAVSVTAWGRQYIGKVNSSLEEKYNAKIIYNDTDSSMVVMDDYVKDMVECKDMIDEICKYVTSLFPDAIIMKPETWGRMLCIKKKKYCFMEADVRNNPGDFVHDDEGGYELTFKGLLPARRDNCKWARDVYKNVLQMIMQRRYYVDVMTYIFDKFDELMSNKVDYHEFIITRSIRDNYKQKNYPMKIFGEQLAKRGKPPKAGERLAYLVAKTNNRDDKLGMKMRLKEEYEDSRLTNEPLQIDYPYYVRRILMNPLDQLISLVYRPETRILNDLIRSRRTERCKWIGMNKPIMQIITRIENGETIEQFRNEFEAVIQGIEEEDQNYIDEILC